MAVPSDPFELLHYNMIRAHDTYKLGYDIIANRLDNPPTDDLKNFLGYCEAWAISIVHHHDTEEETVFPFLNKKMDFSHEQEQHRALHDFLTQFLDLIHEAQSDVKKFDAGKLKQLLLASKDNMMSHFDDELIHIEAAKLKEAEFTEADVKGMVAAMEKHAKANGDPFLVVPYMRSHTPPEYKDVWPPMPWILRKVAIPYLLAKKHSGYWKYCPYAMS